MEHGTFTLKLCMVEVVYSSFTCDSHGATHALTIPLNHKRHFKCHWNAYTCTQSTLIVHDPGQFCELFAYCKADIYVLANNTPKIYTFKLET